MYLHMYICASSIWFDVLLENQISYNQTVKQKYTMQCIHASFNLYNDFQSKC